MQKLPKQKIVNHSKFQILKLNENLQILKFNNFLKIKLKNLIY